MCNDSSDVPLIALCLVCQVRVQLVNIIAPRHVAVVQQGMFCSNSIPDAADRSTTTAECQSRLTA